MNNEQLKFGYSTAPEFPVKKNEREQIDDIVEECLSDHDKKEEIGLAFFIDVQNKFNDRNVEKSKICSPSNERDLKLMELTIRVLEEKGIKCAPRVYSCIKEFENKLFFDNQKKLPLETKKSPESLSQTLEPNKTKVLKGGADYQLPIGDRDDWPDNEK